MKVNPNQLVGGFMEPHETHKDGEVDYHAGLHVGGIPLRLELAMRFLTDGSAPIEIPVGDVEAARGLMRWGFWMADQAIAYHNATREAGEVSDD